MKNNKNIWLCIKDCSVEISAEGSHLFYSAGEFIEEEFAPNQSCFLSVTKTQRRQLQSILNSIAKEKTYQEKQRLIIYNLRPRGNWKAEQRLNGSIQEARSMRNRFNKVVSDIAGKDIEVFLDCKVNDKLRW